MLLAPREGSWRADAGAGAKTGSQPRSSGSRQHNLRLILQISQHGFSPEVGLEVGEGGIVDWPGFGGWSGSG
jgi:hypothetical protein